jgi:hypothetical protein
MNKDLENIWVNAMIENKEKQLESISGVGSTLAYTELLRHELPTLLKKFNISSVFDAPCGDMNWMNVFLKENKINYIGGDIVKHVVDANQQYANDTTKIIHLDITSAEFPDVDLWICRDCWFHLPDKHIFASIDNFLKSNIKYLLTTTHINTGFDNSNLDDVGFKLIDLFKAPYHFPTPLYKITDYRGKKFPREMVLFSRDQMIKWNSYR